mmetsp:Transcript_51223/g.165985  ORF Transcript_51223/g.165985 Transcript_51223/m.165985 type:complete len:200 (-) Transcript_51223:2237-2836(-)
MLQAVCRRRCRPWLRVIVSPNSSFGLAGSNSWLSSRHVSPGSSCGQISCDRCILCSIARRTQLLSASRWVSAGRRASSGSTSPRTESGRFSRAVERRMLGAGWRRSPASLGATRRRRRSRSPQRAGSWGIRLALAKRQRSSGSWTRSGMSRHCFLYPPQTSGGIYLHEARSSCCRRTCSLSGKVSSSASWAETPSSLSW